MGVLGSTGHIRSSGRFAMKRGFMPTIEEDESYEQCSLSVGSSGSESSLSSAWSSEMFGPYGAYDEDEVQSAFDDAYLRQQEQHRQQQQQHQLYLQQQQMGNWLVDADHVDEDELLLAAIEVRLQELLRVREQRQAALKAGAAAALTSSSKAPAFVVSAAPTTTTTTSSISSTRGFAPQAGSMPQAPYFPVGAAAPTTNKTPTTMMQQQQQVLQAPMMQLKQKQQQQQDPQAMELPGVDVAGFLSNLASTQQLNEAGRMAAVKLQQMRAMQEMQLVLQQELLQLLQPGCY